MTCLIIGSWALNHILDKVVREPKDIDVFEDGPDDLSDCFWHDRFYDWLAPDEHRTATLDELYTIKVSHSYWEINGASNWQKHINDAELLKRAGAKLDPVLHKLLYSVWEEKHGTKRVDLNMEKDSFFQDNVVRKYDHDSIHESVAYGDRPMYEKVLKDGSSVAVDMTKLKMLDFEEQVKLFKEEIFATALERIMIPSDYTASPSRAYYWALRRTVTSLTKGWSATFIVDNFDRFRKPDPGYVARHLKNKHRLIEL